MSVNNKTSFALGFISAMCITGVGLHIMGKEIAEHNESVFMAGYVLEVSTLAFILNESDEGKRTEIAKSELCEDINILKSKIEEGSFNKDFFEFIASKSVIEYQLFITGLGEKYCAKNI